MRLWTIHPSYLDQKGLVALWRESLLARKVLSGRTKGYKNHPQLERFKKSKDPSGAINFYLKTIFNEAKGRGYKFNKNKILTSKKVKKINVSNGQILYEFNHLLKKLIKRDPVLFKRFKDSKRIKINPLFKRVDGDVEPWERI